jgi:foldase protein PrsA
MRRGIERNFGLAALVAIATIAASGCGDDDEGAPALPAGTVAKVGKGVVTKARFEAELDNIAFSSGVRGKPLGYHPLDIDACVAANRKVTGRPADELEPGCEQDSEQFRIRALQGALQAEWLRQTAEELRVRPPKSEVRAALDRQKYARFRTAAGYRKFLRTARLTDREFQAIVQTQTLTQFLTGAIANRADEPSVQDVRDYYNSHREQFAEPERRDLRLVLARSKAHAERAKQALRGGASWETVAKRYSIDPDTRKRGGELRRHARSRTTEDLDAAAFNAPAGVLQGPLEAQFGWYVFEVRRIVAAHQRPFRRVENDITTDIFLKRREAEKRRFSRRWSVRYRRRTVCAEDYVIAECANGPASNPAPPTVQAAPPMTPSQPAQ